MLAALRPWPVLVVAPATLRLMWAEELEAWLDLTPSELQASKLPCRRSLRIPVVLQPGVRAVAARSACGCSLGCTRLQPGVPAVAVWDAHSCSLVCTRLQVISHATDALDQRRLASPPRVVVTSFRMAAMLRTQLAAVCTYSMLYMRMYIHAAHPAQRGSSTYMHMHMRMHMHMHQVAWRMVIVDESHTLGTTGGQTDAQQTEAVAALCAAAPHTLLLSGTPSLCRPFQLWRQARVGEGVAARVVARRAGGDLIQVAYRYPMLAHAIFEDDILLVLCIRTTPGGAGCPGAARLHQVGLRAPLLRAAAGAVGRRLGRRAARCGHARLGAAPAAALRRHGAPTRPDQAMPWHTTAWHTTP